MNGLIYCPNSGLSDSFISNFQFVQLVSKTSDLRTILNEAARLNLTNLVIDLQAADGFTVNEAIHIYRIQRPATRIIVLAFGKQPGDPIVAGFISKGIYDIVVPENREDTEYLLTTALACEPASYATAARWAVSSTMLSYIRSESPNRDHKIIGSYSPSEIVIERPIGLTTVAVAGVGHGAGASYISLSLAHKLAINGYKVLLAEFPEGKIKNSQFAHYIAYMGSSLKDDLFDLKGVHVFPNSRSVRTIEFVFQRAAREKYDYLVLDTGPLSSVNISEMERAALPVLVSHVSPTRYDIFNKTLSQDFLGVGEVSFERWQLLLNLANSVHSKWFRKGIDIHFNNVIDVPYFDNPFDEKDNIMPLALSPVMRTTATKIRKRRFFRFK